MTHDEAYKRAIDLIQPHMRLGGRKASASERRDADLREGIGHLDAALRLVPRRANMRMLWAGAVMVSLT